MTQALESGGGGFFDSDQRLGNDRGMPGGRFSGPGDHSGPISGHFRRSRARPPICDLNIVTLPKLRLLRHQQCVLTQDRCLFLQQKTLSGLATEEMSAVETGQMSSVETGQMSAVETGQMSAVETRQMSSAETRHM